MQCNKCEACITAECAESNEQDFECLCGIKCIDLIEHKNGSVGCNLHYMKIKDTVSRDREMEDEYLRSGY